MTARTIIPSCVTLFLGALALAPSAAAITQVAERRLVDQSQEEIEPALITYTHFGVEYSVSVWMNFDPNVTNPNSTLKYTAWTSTGLATTSAIPPRAGYARYADPILVKHPSTTQLYLVGLAYNSTTSGEITTTKTAVLVWSSNNGGWNWSAPAEVASETRTVDTAFAPALITGNLLDKPVAATAPDGRLWTAFVMTNSARIQVVQVRAGTLSGSTWSWGARTSLATPADSHAPQILVDADGDVYVLYTSSSPRIGLMWDDAATPAVSFTALASIPNVGTLYRGSAAEISVRPNVRIRAVSVPIARLDRTRRRISVAWHERSSATSSRLQFATYPTSPQQGPWQNLTFASTGGYDVNVGMDHDANGNYLVTWYRFPPQESRYFNVGKYVSFNANGTPTWTADEGITGRLGDVASLTPDSQGLRHVGEYHDVSYTNGSFKAVHLIIVLPWGDPWVFTVRQ